MGWCDDPRSKYYNRLIKIKKNLKIGYEKLFRKDNKYDLFIPTLPHLKNKIIKLTKNWKINTLVSDDMKANENIYSDVFASVTCSGTASLEISKRMIPQIIIYKFRVLMN